MKTDYKVMDQCGLCRAQLQRGPGLYEGKHIKRYELLVCDACFASNWDGWNHAREAALEAHLKGKGIPLPERNEDGFYPRGDD